MCMLENFSLFDFSKFIGTVKEIKAIKNCDSSLKIPRKEFNLILRKVSVPVCEKAVSKEKNNCKLKSIRSSNRKRELQ